MSLQLTIFDPPRARRSDPITSKLAAHGVRRKAEAQQQMVLRAVRERPGHTSLELVEWTGLDRHTIARRLPEIEKRGLIRRGSVRECRCGHRPALTWYPA